MPTRLIGLIDLPSAYSFALCAFAVTEEDSVVVKMDGQRDIRYFAHGTTPDPIQSTDQIMQQAVSAGHVRLARRAWPNQTEWMMTDVELPDGAYEAAPDGLADPIVALWIGGPFEAALAAIGLSPLKAIEALGSPIRVDLEGRYYASTPVGSCDSGETQMVPASRLVMRPSDDGGVDTGRLLFARHSVARPVFESWLMEVATTFKTITPAAMSGQPDAVALREKIVNVMTDCATNHPLTLACRLVMSMTKGEAGVVEEVSHQIRSNMDSIPMLWHNYMDNVWSRIPEATSPEVTSKETL